MEYIKTLNKMYAEHPYTSDGRVVVCAVPELDAVAIRVFDEDYLINVSNLTDWGILCKVQEFIRIAYDNLPIL